MTDDYKPRVIDAAYLRHQREFSAATFGPGTRRKGVIDHIRKELVEVEACEENDGIEWVDVIILAFDGALRSGMGAQELIDNIAAKQGINEKRTWPDWRGLSSDVAIEHNRSIGAA